MRNLTTTTIAPTGTLSLIAGTSSGIEPLFGIAYIREVMEGTHLLEVNKVFEKIAKEKNFYSEKVIEKIAKTGSLKGVNLPKEIKNVFMTAQEIKPEAHVKMQAVFQRYTDNAVSKTINLKEKAKVKDVEKAYLLAYKLKCKGITVYRYGSKRKQVLSVVGAEFSGGCPAKHCGN